MKAIHRRGLDSQAVVRRYSLKSDAPKNLTNFTGKQLLELFFNKIAGLQARGVQLFQKRHHGDLHGVSNAGVFL